MFTRRPRPWLSGVVLLAARVTGYSWDAARNDIQRWCDGVMVVMMERKERGVEVGTKGVRSPAVAWPRPSVMRRGRRALSLRKRMRWEGTTRSRSTRHASLCSRSIPYDERPRSRRTRNCPFTAEDEPELDVYHPHHPSRAHTDPLRQLLGSSLCDTVLHSRLQWPAHISDFKVKVKSACTHRDEQSSNLSWL